jgi:hypothetical protein
MIAISSLNNENEFMISIPRFNKGGLDESSPYRIDYYPRGY